MFLKLSLWNTIIAMACVGLLNMFLKLWIQNFSIIEAYFGLLIFWVLLKCFYLIRTPMILDYVLLWFYSQWWPYVSLLFNHQKVVTLLFNALLFVV